VKIVTPSADARNMMEFVRLLRVHLSRFAYPLISFSIIIAATGFGLVSPGCVMHRGSVATAESAELSSAYLDLKEGRYSLAVAKYLLIVQQKPNARDVEEARFRLGECYFQMRSYMDAGAQFQNYLADFLNGKFAAEARQYVLKLQEIEKSEREREDLRKKEVETRLKHWQDAAKKEQNSPEIATQLGHALWDAEQYQQAAKEYLRGIRLDADKRNDKLISSRLKFNQDGSVTVLTPDELARIENERNPIIVVNDSDYRGGRDIFTYEPRWYIVTGQVVNRGGQTVRDIGVLVTIYDFAGHVIDSAGYAIGNMKPGQRRSFSVRFTNFENIYNIYRYECEPVFQ